MAEIKEIVARHPVHGVERKAEQTEYESQRGLVSRADLRGQVMPLMDSLHEGDFHTVYQLIWSLSAKTCLVDTRGDDRESLRRQLREAERQLQNYKELLRED